MNGVEAAASLFGSDASETDLFATLGTDTTSMSSDPLFPASEEQAHDLPLHTATYDCSVLAEHPAAKQESDFETTNHVHNFNHQGEWAQEDKNNPTWNYSALNPFPRTSPDLYLPVSQTQPTPQYSHKNYDLPAQEPSALHLAYSSHALPQIATNSTYNAYDPPPASLSTHTNYSVYHPPPASQLTLQPPDATYTPPVSAPYPVPEVFGKAPSVLAYTPPTLAPVMGPNNHQFAQPVHTPVKSSITRPKISNAYDPPFPAIQPTRRSGRPGGTHHVTAYQTSLSTNSYVSPNGPSPAHSGPYYDETAVIQGEYNPVPVERSSHSSFSESSYAQADIAHYAPSGKGHSRHFFSDGNPEQTLIYPTQVEGPSPNQLANYGSAIGNLQSNVAHGYSYNPLDTREVTQPSPELHTTAATRGTLETLSSGGPSKSPTRSISTTGIPLVQDRELASISASEQTNGHLTQHNSSIIPYSVPKRDPSVNKANFNPYAPKVIPNPSSSIPRTSSPLSGYHGRQHEPKKQSINLGSNLNIVAPPYGSFSAPAVTDALSTPVVSEGYASRQGSERNEVKVAHQDLTIKPTVAQYAPSPSLIGANDPLSRTSARAPLVTFGFGGKMITCFHGMAGLNAGFDIAFSSRTSSELKIRAVQELLPESAINSPGPSYPGPLLSDPGVSSISIVRPNAANQTKAKKTALLSYLSERAKEIDQGIGYLVHGEKQAAENKLILVKLLGVMIENDGRLLGTPTSDSAVRSILVPRLEASVTLRDVASLQASFKPGLLDETPICITTLRSSSLDRIEELLLQGDRRQAYQFAADGKLWAHAMIIASSIDKEAWKEVINEFLRSELCAEENGGNESFVSPGSKSHFGRESLRVAYSLFSGQGALSVQELATPNRLHRGFGRLQPPSMTPGTPNFASIQPPSIHPEALAKWAETVAMIISSPLTTETSAALTALGDQLLANDWVEAAHACYLLSPQTSVIGGLGSPSARITVIGSKSPADIMRDMDPLILSEILEFALALVPAIKGQDSFHGVPHLQAYRFIRAVSLAEIGEVQLANRYCDAIAASLSQSSPYTTPAFLVQLQGLQQRLSGVFHGDKSNSWIGGKLSKPSLDTIGGWLEGRFTKLVTGESDSSTPTAESTKASEQTFVGPFAHYSTISSTTPSARSSPQPQQQAANLSFLPPQRTSSAMATATPPTQIQIERSSSAMGYMQQKVAVQTSSKSSSSVASSQSSPGGFSSNGYSHTEGPYAPKSITIASDELETPAQGGSWWGSSNDNSRSTVTPTAAMFMQIEESSIPASGDGFISLMDNQPFSIGPQPGQPQPGPISQEVDDEDELGLGNSKPKSNSTEIQESSPVATNHKASATGEAIQPEKKAEPPAASSGSWLGRWWKQSDSTAPGPIKASLGEESAFYYDKEQKKWVNRKAGNDEPLKPATPLPPPSRAQTASPGMSGPKPPSQSGPPLRSASAIDLTTEPPTKVPMRIRSNLAPRTGSVTSGPTVTQLNPSEQAPPARPKSQATKRNIRNRYVDVFQQESGGVS